MPSAPPIRPSSARPPPPPSSKAPRPSPSDLLARHAIPTADYQNFTEVEPALAYLREKGAPSVIKADGLAAGKGGDRRHDPRRGGKRRCVTCSPAMPRRCRRPGGDREEFLDGEEASFIVMVDGEHVLPMATSRDHKRAFDGDTGPNTGGMGVYSPGPVVTDEVPSA